MDTKRFEQLQDRVLGARPPERWKKPSELLLALKRTLRDGYATDLLSSPDSILEKWVQLDPKVHPNAPGPPANGPHEIVGGVKSSRDPRDAHLKRNDGAWIHFKITVNWDGKEEVQLVSYDFEIVFPAGHTPPWLRIDLNEPGHDNEGLRSHVHPGNDDLMAPAPMMAPEEILDLFVHGLRPRDAENPRR